MTKGDDHLPHGAGRLDAASWCTDRHESPTQVSEQLLAGEHLGWLAARAGPRLRYHDAAVAPAGERGGQYHRAHIGDRGPEGHAVSARPKRPCKRLADS